MSTLILSDIHNQESNETISSLEELIKQECPEKLVFLGDCDVPSVYEYLLSLTLEKRIAIGNHEYCWANNIETFSSFLKFSPGTYIQWWNEFPQLKKFVLEKAELIGENNGKIVIDHLSGRKILYSHCGITWNKSLDSDFCLRLESWGTICDSFKEMQKQDCWLWFKGHDHISQVLSLPKKADVYRDHYQKEPLPVNLNVSQMYIIGVGCFAKGFYAILNERAMKLELKQIAEE